MEVNDRTARPKYQIKSTNDPGLQHHASFAYEMVRHHAELVCCLEIGHFLRMSLFREVRAGRNDGSGEMCYFFKL